MGGGCEAGELVLVPGVHAASADTASNAAHQLLRRRIVGVARLWAPMSNG
ncbi:hypothetical protein MKSMC1_51190 [Mycobacterium kansasii]|nr:hypothetical protein MKSMC1_51190 [Mycobacterium kansasii]